MKLRSISLLFLLIFQVTFSQIKTDRKKIAATRITTPPKIDGILDDAAWKNAELIKDFIVFRPDNGKKVADEYRTIAKVVYNDDAIYISAMMYDPHPDKIPMQFATRDNFSQADFFLATINPNDDGQNPFEFVVQSTGNQGDSKVSNGNEDFNWSAVWESAAKVNDKGWAVEMKIPYSALRFANAPVQHWGFNFHRRLERLNEQHTWTHIDNAVGRWTQHDGLIENLKDIKPPTRLGLYPYASAITDSYNGKTTNDWNLGLDLKYGLSENFTLDATLIPDFSQAGFDNVELNLGPFEQQYAEQRQFFTEGTELFNKGRLFYSRRIGSSPIDQFDVSSQLNTNEEIIDYPRKVTMLNAIKISGRTKNGLGIGFFNAITGKTEAIIKDNSNGKTRKVVTSPFSNYNILVIDKQFNQNSSITLINTNVTRNGNFRDANVTGFLWHVETKDSKYNVDGSVKISNIFDDVNNPNTGYTYDTSFGKNAGRWNWEIGYNFEDQNFNPNDMGILFSNNEQQIYGSAGFRTLKPEGIFNNYGFNFYNNLQYQYESGIYTGYQAGLNFNAQTKKRFSFGANINYGSVSKDFNEPRQGNTSGVYFTRPERLNLNYWIDTNSQKKLQVNFNMYSSTYFNNSMSSFGFGISPNYRFNNQFSLSYNFNYSKTLNDQGYVDKVGGDIIFGERDRKSYVNSVSGRYNFSTKSSLSLSFRHYWSSVDYTNNYFKLNTDGSLSSTTYNNGSDVNFNSWNLDLNYIWQFAPGSQLIALYRNTIFNQDSNSSLDFFKNLDNLFQQPNQNVFSLRVVYYIDYNKLKNIF
ncbi:hypothetical protein KCTC32516_02278 [Polaribacter huanghezhanensis]|uniref:DUF5916 domain-containing protein n=1 Tax=Polaribacter huanghezhanensis TaxID=1354726 RepID=UPI0026497B12|nr:DUF5916 domain-containing protein [Polaribacter huanghezhanensis]WKD86898.1 hypothetical protein KCTC32516_02278 [Polaribacter huanghezhanensis]